MHLLRDREKSENALFEHVRKAVNSHETAPKQKHVRGKNGRASGLCLFLQVALSLPGTTKQVFPFGTH